MILAAGVWCSMCVALNVLSGACIILSTFTRSHNIHVRTVHCSFITSISVKWLQQRKARQQLKSAINEEENLTNI